MPERPSDDSIPIARLEPGDRFVLADHRGRPPQDEPDPSMPATVNAAYVDGQTVKVQATGADGSPVVLTVPTGFRAILTEDVPEQGPGPLTGNEPGMGPRREGS